MVTTTWTPQAVVALVAACITVAGLLVSIGFWFATFKGLGPQMVELKAQMARLDARIDDLVSVPGRLDNLEKRCAERCERYDSSAGVTRERLATLETEVRHLQQPPAREASSPAIDPTTGPIIRRRQVGGG